MNNEYYENKQDIERREPLRTVTIEGLKEELSFWKNQRSTPEISLIYTPGGGLEQQVHHGIEDANERKIEEIEQRLAQRREQSRKMRRTFNRDSR